MILYRIGQIVYKRNSNLIFESQGVGYSLIMPDAQRVEEKNKLKLYIYEIRNDYYQATYAFKDFKERILFSDLIALSGVGPRVAYNILNNGWEKIVALISDAKIKELIKIPYLNPKVARLIVAELQSKWQKMTNKEKNKQTLKKTALFDEAKETLKMLGFKKQQIENVLPKVESIDNIELMIEEAIRLMSTKNESNISTTS